jgi:hypothetical protein
MQTQPLDQMFLALADPERRGMVERLSAGGLVTPRKVGRDRPQPGDLPKLTPKLMEAILSFDGFSDAELTGIKAPTLILQADNDIAPWRLSRP